MRGLKSMMVAGLMLGSGPALAQVPSTDIFLVSVDGERAGKVRRLTDREGYDNQPQFLPDGRRLVYSSQRDGATDIYLFDLESGEQRAVVTSPESEYSPTPVPGHDAISVVRDYGDLKQQLWSFPLDGGTGKLLLPDVSPVGYHAWIDEKRVLLFVLGEPATLQVARVGPGPGTILAPSPGRGLARVPQSHEAAGTEMTYVDKSGDEWWLTSIDPVSGASRRLTQMLAGREDYAWAPDGAAWMADDSRVYRWQPGTDSWRQIADLDADGIYNITRLSFSPDGKSLALVGQRPPADLAAAYREPASRILGAALTDGEVWEKLEYLTTIIGHRLSGSAALTEAIDWATGRMEAEGLTVRRQPVKVPHWVRGEEHAEVVAPFERPLHILGLGDSVGTAPGGITAPLVVVRSFAELEARGRAAIEGKIVLYAVDWNGYRSTVEYRGKGPSRAAALGAVAVLTRSATGSSLSTPHTGGLRYEDDVPRIPAAAVTVEDAAWLRRLDDLGRKMTVHLEMEAQTLEDADSFNVIAEIAGAERPEEVVVMGGHLDSWDVGQGAHDDGAGCMATWQALSLIQQLGLQPRRTLRVVLWTNEENGLRGARAYHEALSATEVAAHVAAIEMDGGAERPVGFGFGLDGVDAAAGESTPAYDAALGKLEQIGMLLASIEAGDINRGGGGADIGPLMKSGVPGLNLRTVGEHYFDWHHTHADTLDKVDVQHLRRAVAALAVTAYVLADMPERLVLAP